MSVHTYDTGPAQRAINNHYTKMGEDRGASLLVRSTPDRARRV